MGLYQEIYETRIVRNITVKNLYRRICRRKVGVSVMKLIILFRLHQASFLENYTFSLYQS